MATEAFEDIAETFEFLDDWEDRYRHVIELGKAMPPMEEALKVPATKVEGCASQVWIMPAISDGRFDFHGDSDAMIVRGLIAILLLMLSGRGPQEIIEKDVAGALATLGLNENLSAQRSNGLRAMVERIKAVAKAAADE